MTVMQLVNVTPASGQDSLPQTAVNRKVLPPKPEGHVALMRR